MFIDNLLLGGVNFVIQTVVVASGAVDRQNPGTGMGASLGLLALSILISCIYFAGMESSARQATLGKMALGIKVTDLSGRRISLPNAIGRYAGKMLSGLICFVGYLMAAFTERKQALHDQIASTLVVRA